MRCLPSGWQSISYGVTLHPGTRFMMYSAATLALDLPTSLGLYSTLCQLSCIERTNSAPEQELSVQVTDVDGVHVNNVDVLEPSKSEIGQDLTSETTSAND
jgi:hypothetical protein